MKCTITGIETNNKFKNVPVSKEAIEIAKEAYPNLSTKHALIQLRIEIYKKRLELRKGE